MSATISYTIDEWTKKIPCKTVLTVGRDKSSDIVLTDLMVSRNHAMIRRVGSGDYYLIDGGSANGSYVNKQRVTVPRLLKNGDVIAIGRVEFLFEQEAQSYVEVDTLSLQETIVHDKPEIKQITILVADIRGFTSLSEGLPIRTLTRMMNTWFNDVSDIIFSNNGIVDKFIGDCVFARWETDDNQAETVIRALSAAEDINRVTEDLNSDFNEIAEQLKIGVGINTGAASMGIGVDNSALGDAVNIAFRLESVTKTLGKDIVMSETAYRHLPRQCWEESTQKIRVKGRRDPIRIFALNFGEVQRVLETLN
jgi:adenylate cyclase